MAMWLGRVEQVGKLVAAKQYKKAIVLLRQNLQADQDNIWLRQQLADVLVLDGQKELALAILSRLADSFAQDGFHAKAIAVIKKMQRIDPSHADLEKKLAGIMGQDAQQKRLDAALKRPDQTRFARLDDVPPARPPEPPTVAEAPPPFQIVAGEPELPADQATIARQPTSREEEEFVLEVFGEPVETEAWEQFKGAGRSPLFSELSDSELVAVMRGLDLLTFEPGEIVVSEGEPGDSLFVLAAGTVRVFARDHTGRNRQIRTLEEGEFFGEVSLITGQPRSATVTAAAPCELLELPQAALRAMAEKHPKLPLVISEFCDRRLGSREEAAARGEPPVSP